MFIRPLILCLFLAMTLSSCGTTPPISSPYPLWGEGIELTSEIGQKRHLQIKFPGDNTPLACILIVHGMNEYIGRYGEIADYFADRFVVAGIDLTAHGLSNPVIAKAQQQLETADASADISDAYIQQAQLRNLQPMRDDLHLAMQYLLQRCDQATPGQQLPVFILSHSLGSLVSASYLLQSESAAVRERVAGIILTGPAFSVTQVPGWRGWFQNPFVRFSYHTQEHFLHPQPGDWASLLFNQLLALLTVPLHDGIIELLSLPGMRQMFSPSTPSWVTPYLSNWENERQRHKADAYIIRRSVLRYVLSVEKEIIAFRRRMSGFDIPYLLIYSEFDPITPAWGNTDFIAASKMNHAHNQTMMLAGESHHEQLFSYPQQQQQVLQTIRTWIELRMDKE